jgi:hypothetical protein
MNRAEAEQIASAISIIRPDWLQSSIVTLLGKHQHRPARDAMLALAWIAYDPQTTSPGRINADGPWWGAGRLAGTTDTTATPPPYERPKPSAPPATPEQIRAIREAARLSKEETNAEYAK